MTKPDFVVKDSAPHSNCQSDEISFFVIAATYSSSVLQFTSIFHCRYVRGYTRTSYYQHPDFYDISGYMVSFMLQKAQSDVSVKISSLTVL